MIVLQMEHTAHIGLQSMMSARRLPTVDQLHAASYEGKFKNKLICLISTIEQPSVERKDVIIRPG